jgi:hypothetical protein
LDFCGTKKRVHTHPGFLRIAHHRLVYLNKHCGETVTRLHFNLGLHR